MDEEILKWLVNQALPSALILGAAAFGIFKAWPWWTKEYLPAKQKADIELRRMEMARDDRRDAALEALRTTLAELPMALSHSTGIAVKEQAGAAVAAAESSILSAVNAAKLEVLRGQEALTATLSTKVDAAAAAAKQGAFDEDAVQDAVHKENQQLESRMFQFIGAMLRPSGAQSIAEGKTQ